MRLLRIRFLVACTALAALAVPTPREHGLPTIRRLPQASQAGTSAVPEGLTAGDWARIRDAYETNRLSAASSDEGYRARNPGQRWVTRFDGRGFTTTPDGGGWSWGLELVRYGFPGAEQAIEGEAHVRFEGPRVVHGWDGTLEEHYVNERQGLEHGFTISARPPRAEGSEGPLRITLLVRGGLEPEVSEDGRSARFVDAAGDALVSYGGLLAWDATGTSLPARMVGRAGSLELEVDERGACYPLAIDPLAQQAYLKASNTGTSDFFGRSVSVSGDTVVVGAHGESSNATGVNGSQADNSASNAGAAYVFVRNGTTWTQEAYLKASNTGTGDFFGYAVSVSGDTVVVGAYGEDSNATGVDGDQANNNAGLSGAAYVFVRNGTTWTQQAYLKASNTAPNASFGNSVSVSGDTVVVGALFENSNGTANGAGAAYVFVPSGMSWMQQAYLKASNSNAGDLFGNSVSISGDTVVVGAHHEDSNATDVNGNQTDNSALDAGAAYVFVRSGVIWMQQAYLKASNTDAGDAFGYSVSVSGDTAVVGAYFEDSNATGVNGDQANNSALVAGAAYVFVRNGATWTQDAYLKASNTDAGDNFGYSVSVSDNTVVVGATQEDSNATGVNGDQANNSTTTAGAVYVFVRIGAGWAQEAYLKASNTDSFDAFGTSVFVSGNTVIVGAQGEASTATGVNGNEADNFAGNAGAAYAFFLPPAVATFRNAGANPASYVSSAPILGQQWTATVDLTTTGHAFALLYAYDSPTTVTLGGGQVLLCAPLLGYGRLLRLVQPGPVAVFNLNVPASPILCGFSLCTQALHFGTVNPYALSNAYDLTFGVR